MKFVADCSAYDEAYQRAVDWLLEAEEQLNTVCGKDLDSHEIAKQHQNMVKV